MQIVLSEGWMLFGLFDIMFTFLELGTLTMILWQAGGSALDLRQVQST